LQTRYELQRPENVFLRPETVPVFEVDIFKFFAKLITNKVHMRKQGSPKAVPIYLLA